MGRRTNPRLAQSKPPPGKGFRGVDRERQSVGLHCLGAAAHQEISLTLTQCFFDTIQLFRFRFRHLADDAIDCNAITLKVGREIYITPELEDAHVRTKQELRKSRIPDTAGPIRLS